MHTERISFGQRVLAALCAILILVMLFPQMGVTTFAAGEDAHITVSVTNGASPVADATVTLTDVLNAAITYTGISGSPIAVLAGTYYVSTVTAAGYPTYSGTASDPISVATGDSQVKTITLSARTFSATLSGDSIVVEGTAGTSVLASDSIAIHNSNIATELFSISGTRASAKVTAVLGAPGQTQAFQVNVNGNAVGSQQTAYAPGVTLSASNTAVNVGASITLTPTVYRVNGEDAAATVTYEKTDSANVIQINGNTVSAQKAGSASVVAKSGSYTSAAVTITVSNVGITSAAFDANAYTLTYGAQPQTVMVTPVPADATIQEIVWAPLDSQDFTLTPDPTDSRKATISAKKGHTSSANVTFTATVKAADNTTALATASIALDKKSNGVLAYAGLTEQEYTGAAITLAPTDFTLDGAALPDASKLSVSAAQNNTNATIKEPGVYDITATYTDDNYANTVYHGTLNVTPKTLSISLSKQPYQAKSTYTDVDAALSGFVAGDTAATSCKVTAAATSKLTVGGTNNVTITYPATFVKDETHYVYPAQSTLALQQAEVKAVVSCDAQGKPYDATNAASKKVNGSSQTLLSAALTGILTGDTVTAQVNGGTYASVNVANDVSISSYTVALTGTDVGNYVLAANNPYNTTCNGNITPNKTDVTVTVTAAPSVADPGSKVGVGISVYGVLDTELLTGTATISYTTETGTATKTVAIENGVIKNTDKPCEIDAVPGEQTIRVTFAVDATACPNYANPDQPFGGSVTYNASYKVQIAKFEDSVTKAVYGDSVALQAKGYDKDNTNLATNAEMEYTSGNTAAATIDTTTGAITVVNVGAAVDGKVTFYARAKRVDGKYNASYQVEKTVALAKREITVTLSCDGKVYDNTTDAIVTYDFAASTGSGNGIVTGDTVQIKNNDEATVLTATYDKADVGNRTVTASALSIVSDASHYDQKYTLKSNSVTVGAAITAFELTADNTTIALTTDGEANGATDTMYYTGAERKPVIAAEAVIGEETYTLVENRDFTLKYQDNTDVNAESGKTPTVTFVTKSGNFITSADTPPSKAFVIAYAPTPESAATVTGKNGGKDITALSYPRAEGAGAVDRWFNSDVTLTPKTGYTIQEEKPVTDIALAANLVYSEETLDAIPSRIVYVKETATGFISQVDVIDALKIDTTVPVLKAVASAEADDAPALYEREAEVYFNTAFTYTFAVDEANYTDAETKVGVEAVSAEDAASVTSSLAEAAAITVTVDPGTAEVRRNEYHAWLSVTDAAGNEMIADEKIAFANTYDVVTVKEGKATVDILAVLDAKAPEAVVDYFIGTDETGTQLEAEYYYDETAYYKDTFTTVYAFTDEGGLDRDKLFTRHVDAEGKEHDAAVDLILKKNSANASTTVQAKHNDPTDNGTHVFGTFGTDMAGNPLTVTEKHTNKDGASTQPSAGHDAKAPYLGKDKVLDTVSPKLKLAVNTQAERKALQPTYNNRFYFNQGFDAAFAVEEINFDAQRITAQWGKNAQANNYQTDSVSIQMAMGAPVRQGNVNTYVSQSDSDGLYAYSFAGSDKAGNRVELSDNTNFEQIKEPFTSYVIAVDTVRPKVNVKFDDFYAAQLSEGSNYSVSLNHPYQSRSIAKADLLSNDCSPVTVRYTVTSTVESQSVQVDTGDVYEFENHLTSDFNAQQILFVEHLKAVDLAGNTSEMSTPSNKIYLDTTIPEGDKLAPNVAMVATARGEGRGPAGNPLYNTDVTINAKITDPYEGISASGLYKVLYKVTVNGEDWTDRVAAKSNAGGNAGGGVVTYGTGGPSFSEDASAEDERITCVDSIDFAFASTTFNYNDIKIFVWAMDNSGNEIAEANAAYYYFGIDITNPTIKVSYNNNDVKNEKYFKADRTATIEVIERNFDQSRTQVMTESLASIGSWSYTRGAKANGDDDIWTCKVDYTKDGDYTFDVKATDLVGLSAPAADYGASVAPRIFTLDKTKPVIEIDFNNKDVRNGKYYNASRTATIRIEEHNFAAKDTQVTTTANIAEGSVSAPSVGGFSTGGDINTANVPFTQDGDYTMDVKFVDLAGNEAEPKRVDEFTVDTTAPELEITGVEDKVAYNGDVAPTITYHDINYDNTSAGVTITGYKHPEGSNLTGARADDAFGGSFVCDNIEAVKDNDDVYTATGSVSDLAGNLTETTILFSVNRFGSTYMLASDTQKLVESYYTNLPEALKVTEINVSALTKQEVTTNLNGELKTLAEGNDYTLVANNPGWQQYDYLVKAENFNNEGAYTVTLYSEDEATNTNTNSAIKENDGKTNELPISFLVDMTAPVNLITGVNQDEQYVETQRTVMIRYDDNTAVEKLTLYTNDTVVAEYGPDDLSGGNGELQYTAKAANQWQELKVSSVDVAGNISEATTVRFLLTDNVFVQYYSNKPLFFGSLASVGVLGTGVFFLLKRRRKITV